jgi:oxygen-independent coproporphyrinogen-3 oxidase
MPQTHSLYIHIPFCSHRCAYCDFNTYAGQESSIPDYVSALAREAAYIGENAPDRLNLGSIFFGGGTPSLLSADQLASILGAVGKAFNLVDPEITLEANPGTVSLKNLREIRSIGINRISIGVQSANPDELRMLEREHDYYDVVNAVKWARQAGFADISLDLIYGLPLQTRLNWSSTLGLVLGLAPDHLSLYALTLEHGTPFGRWAARGLIPAPDPDLAADMYEYAGVLLQDAGFEQYEISNWARPGRECRHNLGYWRGLPYLAIGAGGHGYASGYRYSNVLRIKTYLDRMQQPFTQTPFPLTPATVNQHLQSMQEDASEFMIMGLRLTREGISAKAFEARFARELDEMYGKEIDELVRLELLERQGDRVRLTHRGRLLGNQVFMRFVSESA